MPQQVVADEVRQLRRSMNDLVGLAALPAMWVGRDAAYVVNTLLDALAGMLDADFVYVGLTEASDARSAARVGRAMGRAPADIIELLSGSLGKDHASWPVSGEISIGGAVLAIAAAPMGLEGEVGIVAAGSRRAGFADEAERLLLSVAANQAALALKGARRLDEQRQIASGLDERVAQRTAELAAVNEALRLEVAERQRTEEALRFSERQSREIVDSIPTLVGLLGPMGQVELVNRQIHEFTGRSREELEQWGMSDLVHPDDRAAAIDSFAAGFASGKPFEIVYRMRRHDGVYRWFAGLHSPLQDASGAIIRWCVACNDIEDRKRVEDALRETERAWRSVINGIPGLTATLSPVGMVEAVNQQIIDYTGCELEELRGWGTNGIVHPDDMPHVAEIFGRSIAAGTSYEIEQRLRRHDGEYRWFSNRGTPAFDAEGKILRWYVLLVDIEEARQVADALRASDENARFIVDTIAGMVAIFTPDGRLSGSNQQLLDYFEQPLEEVAKWATNGMTHPDDLQHCIDSFMGAIAIGEPYDFETRFRRFDGVFRWFQIRGRPLRDAAGNIVRWYGLLTDIDDRKHAEDVVAGSEREMRLMLDSIAAGIAVFDTEGHVIGANRQLLDYFGGTLEQLQQWGTSSFVHPDDLRAVKEFFQHWFATNEAGTVVGRLRRFDGVYRWYQATNTALRNEAGQIIRWYGLFADIDNQKRAEEFVADSERNLQLTVDTIPALAWSARTDGTADFFNRSYLDYVGKTPEELSGWAWTEAVHPDDIAKLGAAWAQARESGVGTECEARMRGADGSYRWFIFRANPLLDDSGNVVQWYGINTDIEDRKRAEEGLRLSEASLAEAQRLSALGSFLWRLDTDELTFSDELYRIFEFETGRPVTLEQIADRVDPDDVPLLAEKMELARVGINDHEYDIRLRMPDGRIKHLRSVSRSGTEPDGRQVFRGTIQDVTQRKLAEEALNELRTELAHVSRVSTLGAMTASIAHEVNQPLAGIITNASTCLRMLAVDPPDIDGALETARRTIRDGNRAAEVVTRLRAMFRKRSQITDAMDLNEAVRDVIALASSELRKSRVELETSLAAQLPLIVGDRIQLQQVILNLLLNAADAVSDVTGRPRRAVLRTSEDEDGNVRLTVEDTGVGIDPEHATRLFDAFYTTKAGGMGIGLSVSRSIIEHHGGRIWASANDGPGASFSFAIPRAANQHSKGEVGATAVDAPYPTGKTND